jgi:hypothetical protein
MPYSSFSIHSKKAEIKSGRGLVRQFLCVHSPRSDNSTAFTKTREDAWFDMASFRPLEFSLATPCITAW